MAEPRELLIHLTRSRLRRAVPVATGTLRVNAGPVNSNPKHLTSAQRQPRQLWPQPLARPTHPLHKSPAIDPEHHRTSLSTASPLYGK
jgi:hypothetical protein